jgi:hypothetical protein
LTVMPAGHIAAHVIENRRDVLARHAGRPRANSLRVPISSAPPSPAHRVRREADLQHLP